MPPPAATITIRATLSMLDGARRDIAEAVANDQYVFWLGSGISRARMPDLRDLSKRIMLKLQSHIDQTAPNCRYRSALDAVVALAEPSHDESANIDYSQSPDQWLVFDTLAARLVNNYARMLDVSVDGEEADFLLWYVLDAAKVYSDPAIEPDAEHLCLAALAIEGVASEMPSANWDPLVERAVSILSGLQPILRTVIAPQDTRSNRRRTNLYKFHGCAQAAHDDAAQFRRFLVARQSQISGYIAHNAVMGNVLTNLIVTKRTLMLGLSAQDSNIQGIFAAANTQMPWRWPAQPPAYAFAENALGGDQKSLLRNVYCLDDTPGTRPEMETAALVQAYAKPLLLSLLLYVVTAKLKMLVGHGVPHLAAADLQKLYGGLIHARDYVADGLAPTAEAVLELLKLSGRAMTMLRQGALPVVVANGHYTPISPDPVDRMLADPTLAGGGVCQFAVASGLIGLGLERGLWTAGKPDVADTTSGALILFGRSGPAKIYFAANPEAAIRLRTNGLIAANDDAVIVHSHENPPSMPRFPRRPPGRSGLAAIREVSVDALLAVGTEVEDLLERFRSKVAL
ncbi:MAG: SIR2 family protein [Aliidongia sp.]